MECIYRLANGRPLGSVNANKSGTFEWYLFGFLNTVPMLVMACMVTYGTWSIVMWLLQEYGWITRFILASVGVCIDVVLLFYSLAHIDTDINTYNAPQSTMVNTATIFDTICYTAAVRLIGICYCYSIIDMEQHSFLDVLQRSILFGIFAVAWSRSQQVMLLGKSQNSVRVFRTSNWEIDNQLTYEDNTLMAVVSIGRGVLYCTYLWNNQWYLLFTILLLQKILSLALCCIRFCAMTTTNQFEVGTITWALSDQEECCVCTEHMDTKYRVPVILPCSHRFCSCCVRHWLYTGRIQATYNPNTPPFKCPYCMQIHTPRISDRAEYRTENQFHIYLLLGL